MGLCYTVIIVLSDNSELFQKLMFTVDFDLIDIVCKNDLKQEKENIAERSPESFKATMMKTFKRFKPIFGIKYCKKQQEIEKNCWVAFDPFLLKNIHLNVIVSTQ